MLNERQDSLANSLAAIMIAQQCNSEFFEQCGVPQQSAVLANDCCCNPVQGAEGARFQAVVGLLRFIQPFGRDAQVTFRDCLRRLRPLS